MQQFANLLNELGREFWSDNETGIPENKIESISGEDESEKRQAPGSFSLGSYRAMGIEDAVDLEKQGDICKALDVVYLYASDPHAGLKRAVLNDAFHH